MKIVYNSGTSVITQRITGVWAHNLNVPYRVTNVTGSVVKTSPNNSISWALGSSTTTFYSFDNVAVVTSAITTNNFANTAAGDKRGLRFKVPFACRFKGVQWYNSTSAGDFTVHLHDDAGGSLGSKAYEGDRSGSVSYTHLTLPTNSRV